MGKGDAGVDSHWGLQVLNTGMDASHTDKRGSGDPGTRPEIRSRERKAGDAITSPKRVTQE